ncbi:unnamed protein product [Paramecium sonneborni]|uniref:Uncharacterized protein n=1 Tax=Paramecium sonneborni TaxID=65129 RepID=A0A8S1L2I2_9CILI|nr:unnamed protein product [Paramecium sonneborni]
MGSSCNQLQSSSNEDNKQIQSDIQYQGPSVKIPVFTRKLELNLKIDKGLQQIRPKRIDESVMDITTERNLHEQNTPQFYLINQIQFKKKEDSCQSYRKQQQQEDLLQEICANEVISQISVYSKKEDEYEEYYNDLVKENEWDQFKFQPIFIMKMVDRSQSQQK